MEKGALLCSLLVIVAIGSQVADGETKNAQGIQWPNANFVKEQQRDANPEVRKKRCENGCDDSQEGSRAAHAGPHKASRDGDISILPIEGPEDITIMAGNHHKPPHKPGQPGLLPDPDKGDNFIELPGPDRPLPEFPRPRPPTKRPDPGYGILSAARGKGDGGSGISCDCKCDGLPLFK